MTGLKLPEFPNTTHTHTFSLSHCQSVYKDYDTTQKEPKRQRRLAYKSVQIKSKVHTLKRCNLTNINERERKREREGVVYMWQIGVEEGVKYAVFTQKPWRFYFLLIVFIITLISLDLLYSLPLSII